MAVADMKLESALADKLGIAFYDKSLIDITAKESGFTADYISKK